MLFWTNAFPSEWCKRWPKRKERGTVGSSLFHKSPGQRGSRSRTHVRSIYDVLSFLGDLCPRVPPSLSLSLSTSSPRQLVQPLRLPAASQRPPNPATLAPRVRISKGDIFPTNVPFCTRGAISLHKENCLSRCDQINEKEGNNFRDNSFSLKFCRVFKFSYPAFSS